jgi:hypothetical protein
MAYTLFINQLRGATMQAKEIGKHVVCGGAVMYEGTNTATWRRCLRCGANTRLGQSVELDGVGVKTAERWRLEYEAAASAACEASVAGRADSGPYAEAARLLMQYSEAVHREAWAKASAGKKT